MTDDLEEDDGRLFLKLSELGLDARTGHVFREQKIVYLGQLLRYSDRDLLRLAGFGISSLHSIDEKLHGLKLRRGYHVPMWTGFDADDIAELFKSEIVQASSNFARSRRRIFDGESLEDELNVVLNQITEGQNLEIISRRYGFDGAAPDTLHDVGIQNGISRQRVQQIGAKFQKKIQVRTWHMPQLEKTLKLIADNVPNTKLELESILKADGVCRSNFDLAAVLSISALFGIEASITKTSLQGEPDLTVYVKRGEKVSLKNFQTIAKKLVSSQGVTSIGYVTQLANSELNRRFPEKIVFAVVRLIPGFVLLDQENGWFWFPNTRNRLLNILHKFFAVAEQADVSEIRLAVQKVRRLKGFCPPRRVLLGLCNHLPEFSVDGSVIQYIGDEKHAGALGRVESILFEVLLESGGSLDRIRFRDRCMSRGVNESTFEIYLGVSPILLKLGRGVYGLVGTDVSASYIKHLENQIPKIKPIVGWTWTADGNLKINYRITDNIFRTGFFTIPRQIKDYFSENMILKDSDGNQFGVIKFKEGIAWTLKQVLRTFGGDLGDQFSITFGLSDGIAIIEFDDFDDEQD